MADAVTDADRSLLHPDEWALCQDLAPALRPGSLGGRVALRKGLLQMSEGPLPPLLKNHRGAPTLPPGFIGSISHKRELAVALAARDDGGAIGVDVENLDRRGPDIGPRVLVEGERAALASLAADEQRRQTLLAFAVKEALYKALDPFLQRYVRFAEAALDLPVALPPPLSEPNAAPSCVSIKVTLMLTAPHPPLVATAACLTHERFVIATARVAT